MFTLNGSLKRAQVNLRQKAMRGNFCLKSMVGLNSLKKETTFKLFDALIVPVAAYGCPMPNLVAIHQPYEGCNFPIRMSSQTGRACQRSLRKSPLNFHKTLIVGKYTRNAAIWGDTGRYPLAIESSQQAYSYLEWREQIDSEESTGFLRHALVDQKDLDLIWFSNLKAAQAKTDTLANNQSSTHKKIKNLSGQCF